MEDDDEGAFFGSRQEDGRTDQLQKESPGESQKPVGPLLPDGQPFAESSERFHRAASAIMGGKEDFGDPDYLDALRILLQSLDEEAELSPIGRQSLAGIVVTALCGRLSSEASWAREPDAQTRDFPLAPLLIVGLPRTGTTALHRMLCSDPRHQGLELWLGQSPKPRPAAAEWNSDADYRRCELGVKELFAAAPEMAKIHSMAADAPDECWNLMRQSFASVTFECVAHIPSYSAWWADCDMAGAYERWARNLHLIGSREPEKRWILKDPSHLFSPEALLEAAPEALIVMTHRDPARSIPSVCSLNATARIANEKAPDLRALGSEQIALWSRGMERFMAARARHPDRFIDLHFTDFQRDPLASVEGIYARMGSPLASEIRSELAAWQRENPSGEHHYGAGEFGLDPERIRTEFREYVEAFEIPPEA
jgi:hypothetical protein